MAHFELDEEQVEAIYLALKGERNQDTLKKLKPKLELAQMHLSVREVDQQLRTLEGTGIQQPGLLRLFNPQRDALAEAGNEQALDFAEAQLGRKKTRGKKKGEAAADDTAALPLEGDLAAAGDTVAARAFGQDEAGDIQWPDEVPQPRPKKGQLVVWPSGESPAIVDVLGYDGQASAFRVVAEGSWDGMVVSYGLRSMQQWRILPMLLSYADASAWEKEPLGSQDEVLPAARQLAHALEVVHHALPVDEYLHAAQELLRYALALMPEAEHENIRDSFGTIAGLELEQRPHLLGRMVLYNLEQQYGPEPVEVEEDLGDLLDRQDLQEAGGEVGGLPVHESERQDEQDLAEGRVPLGATDPDEARLAESVVAEEVAAEELANQQLEDAAKEPQPIVSEEHPESGRHRGGRRKKAKE